jgi:hypothetical protein
MLGRVVTKRCFSVVVADSPRTAIARNILRFDGVAAAENEAAVKTASSTARAIDAHALPEQLQGLGGYLGSSTAGTAVKGFKPNPNHWRYAGIANLWSRQFSQKWTTQALWLGMG